MGKNADLPLAQRVQALAQLYFLFPHDVHAQAIVMRAILHISAPTPQQPMMAPPGLDPQVIKARLS
jgi:hypothetical protein